MTFPSFCRLCIHRPIGAVQRAETAKKDCQDGVATDLGPPGGYTCQNLEWFTIVHVCYTSLKRPFTCFYIHQCLYNILNLCSHNHAATLFSLQSHKSTRSRSCQHNTWPLNIPGRLLFNYSGVPRTPLVE